MNAASLYTLYLFLALGAAGVYLCLPAGRQRPDSLRWAAGILGVAALAGLSVYCLRWIGDSFDGRVVFAVFAVIAVAAATRVVTHPKPVYCALYFVLVVLAVTGLCLLAAAEFLGATLVIVYAGAILVTYVFVIMLSQQKDEDPANRAGPESLAAVTLGFLLTAAVTQAMASAGSRPDLPELEQHAVVSGIQTEASSAGRQQINPSSVNGSRGNVLVMGETLMTTYVVAIEIAGVLLLVALVGAVALVRKRIEPEELTPHETAALVEDKDLRRRGREAPPF